MSTTINKYRKYFILHLALVFCTILQFASGARAAAINGPVLPLKSEGNLVFYTDLYQYETSGSEIRLEVCYSLDLSQLNLESHPRQDYFFTFDLKLYNKSGEVVHSIVDIKRVAVNDNRPGNVSSFIDMVKVDLSPDTLNLVLGISDSLSGLTGTINKLIAIRPLTGKLSISDPVFIASLTKNSGIENVFTKHNLDMVPNPARFFEISESRKSFYVYLEINNLYYNVDKPSMYSLTCSVENLAGQIVDSVEHHQLQKVAANTSRIEKISLENLQTGMYSVNILVADIANDNTSSARRYFRVYKDGESSMVLPMAEADVKKYYDQIKYIASRQELNVFDELDPAGKQEFLLQFWKKKDPTPDTPQNEFMLNHFQKIQYCEQNFRNGINCDQGRVYIQYGPPVDVERSTSTLAYSKPVEIWTYSLEGRIEFVFVDRTNDDHFVLMHSTHPDEYYNPNWMNDFRVYR